jgi:hypothetical protein
MVHTAVTARVAAPQADAAQAMREALRYCVDSVRCGARARWAAIQHGVHSKHDYENHLIASMAPRSARATFYALRAFNLGTHGRSLTVVRARCSGAHVDLQRR